MDGDIADGEDVYGSPWDAKVALRLAHAEGLAESLNARLQDFKALGGIRSARRLTTGAMNALQRGLVVVDEDGFMRCPPGTPNAMEFTDHLGANCGGRSGGRPRIARVSLDDLGGTLRDSGVSILSQEEIRAHRVAAGGAKPNPVRLYRRLTEAQIAERAASGKPSLDLSNFSDAQRKQMLGYLRKAPGFGWVDPENKKHFDLAVKQLADNMMHLMRQTTAENRQRWRRWYDIANRFNTDLSKDLNLPTHLVAAITARFSPQKDWYENTAMAEHAARLLSDKNFVVDRSIAETALVYSRLQWERRQEKGLTTAINNAKKKLAEAEEKLAEWEAKGSKANIEYWRQQVAAREAGLAAAIEEKESDVKPTLDDLLGKRLDELSVRDAASVLRAHGELVGGEYLGQPEAVLSKAQLDANASSARLLAWDTIFDDDGEPGDHTMVAKETNPVKAQSWDVYNSVVRMFRSGGDMAVIDDELGDGSKVRSFYNNMLFPNDVEHKDTTIDTHALAGLLLTPIAASHEITDLAFTTVDGLGTGQAYAMFRAAIISVAQQWEALTGEAYLPREIQSITWEMMKQFTDSIDKDLVVNRIAQIHNLAAAGKKQFKGDAGRDAVMRLLEAANSKGSGSKAELIAGVVKELGLPPLTDADILPKSKKK